MLSAVLQGYLVDSMPYLVHCFAYQNHIAASACACLKKDLFQSGGRFDFTLSYLVTEGGCVALE